MNAKRICLAGFALSLAGTALGQSGKPDLSTPEHCLQSFVRASLEDRSLSSALTCVFGGDPQAKPDTALLKMFNSPPEPERSRSKVVVLKSAAKDNRAVLTFLLKTPDGKAPLGKLTSNFRKDNGSWRIIPAKSATGLTEAKEPPVDAVSEVAAVLVHPKLGRKWLEPNASESAAMSPPVQVHQK